MNEERKFGGLVLCRLNDFREDGRLKPGYRDKDGCWVRRDRDEAV
jgi:hypothetical protein